MAGAEQHYTGKAGRIYHQEKRGIPAESFDWVARHRAQKIQPHLLKTDCVLEIGAGAGWNLAALDCCRRIASDVSSFLAEEIQKRGMEFLESTEACSTGSVDVIISHHVLEHVLVPSEMLREIRRLLRPGGKMLLYVPYERERRYHHFDPSEPNHHLYSWNPQTLGNLVSECGFEVQSIALGTYGYDRFAACQAVRLGLGEPGYRCIRTFLALVRPIYEVRLIARKPVSAVKSGG